MKYVLNLLAISSRSVIIRSFQINSMRSSCLFCCCKVSLISVQFFYIILIKVKCSLIVQHVVPFYAIVQYVSVTLNIGLRNSVIIVVSACLNPVKSAYRNMYKKIVSICIYVKIALTKKKKIL